MRVNPKIVIGVARSSYSRLFLLYSTIIKMYCYFIIIIIIIIFLLLYTLDKNEDKYEYPTGWDCIFWSKGFPMIHKQLHDVNSVIIGDGVPFPSKWKNTSIFPLEFDNRKVEEIYERYSKVYAANLDRRYLTPSQNMRTIALPIGIDFHTLQKGDFWGEKQQSWKDQLKILRRIRNDSLPLLERDHRILLTWKKQNDSSNRHSTYMSRPEIMKMMISSPVCNHFTGSRTKTWQEMAKYAFVYSPIGTGFDCHRLWEAIALGCIVIVQNNPCASEFTGMFPIILHDPTKGVPTPQQLRFWINHYKSTSLENMSMRKFMTD